MDNLAGPVGTYHHCHRLDWRLFLFCLVRYEPGRGFPNKNLRLQGELWAIHGGGIYEVQKYELAPPVMPKKLHWFKWEAYSTWLTGTALLVLVYYGRAQTYLVDDESFIHDPTTAVLASVGFLISGVLGYELIVRRRNLSNQNLSTLVTLWLAFLCWVAFQLLVTGLRRSIPVRLLPALWQPTYFSELFQGEALVAAITSGEAVDPAPALLRASDPSQQLSDATRSFMHAG